jgi:hypothetical protein
VSPLEGAIIADHLLGFEYDVLESVL